MKMIKRGKSVRNGVLILAFVLQLWAGASSAQSTTFLSTLEDIPLLDGLSELSEGAMHFDTPGGRIVDVYAAGALKAADVQAYYEATLPALGWVKMADNTYGREGEKLVISSAIEGGVLVVHFALAPAKK